jgi:hypothetical protein
VKVATVKIGWFVQWLKDQRDVYAYTINASGTISAPPRATSTPLPGHSRARSEENVHARCDGRGPDAPELGRLPGGQDLELSKSLVGSHATLHRLVFYSGSLLLDIA